MHTKGSGSYVILLFYYNMEKPLPIEAAVFLFLRDLQYLAMQNS